MSIQKLEKLILSRFKVTKREALEVARIMVAEYDLDDTSEDSMAAIADDILANKGVTNE